MFGILRKKRLFEDDTNILSPAEMLRLFIFLSRSNLQDCWSVSSTANSCEYVRNVLADSVTENLEERPSASNSSEENTICLLMAATSRPSYRWKPRNRTPRSKCSDRKRIACGVECNSKISVCNSGRRVNGIWAGAAHQWKWWENV